MLSPDKQHWIEAILAELNALKDMEVYTLISLDDLPPGCRVLRHIQHLLTHRTMQGKILLANNSHHKYKVNLK